MIAIIFKLHPTAPIHWGSPVRVPVVICNKHGDGQRKQVKRKRVTKVKTREKSGMRRDVVASVVVGSIHGAFKGVNNSIVMVGFVFVSSHAVVEACVKGEKGKRGGKMAAGLAALLQTVTVTRQTMRGASSRSVNATVRDKIPNRNPDTFVCNVKY